MALTSSKKGFTLTLAYYVRLGTLMDCLKSPADDDTVALKETIFISIKERM